MQNSGEMRRGNEGLRPNSLSFRDGPKDQTRNIEIPGLVLTHHPGMTTRLLFEN